MWISRHVHLECLGKGAPVLVELQISGSLTEALLTLSSRFCCMYARDVRT